jgi:hypothetical protein
MAENVGGHGYEECIVAFIDVLGFRAHLKSKTPQEIKTMLSALRSATKPDEPIKAETRMKYRRLGSEVVVENISDAVVRVRTVNTQYRDGAFFWELMDLLHAQIACISQGVLIRAGVTLGEIHIGLDGEGPIFGPALVRAYEMEAEEVIYPRIAIEDAVLERFRKDQTLWKEGHSLEDELKFIDNILIQDEAGMSFIDYLRASESEHDNFASYLDFLVKHKTLVNNGSISITQPKVRRKYQWLATYHNALVAEILAKFQTDAESVTAFEEEFDADPLEILTDLEIIR